MTKLKFTTVYRRGAGMVKWWEHSLPMATNVARDRFSDPTLSVGWVCYWFSSLLERFFFGYSGFPLSSKTNFSKFQFDPDFSGLIATLWRCHLNSHLILICFAFTNEQCRNRRQPRSSDSKQPKTRILKKAIKRQTWIKVRFAVLNS